MENRVKQKKFVSLVLYLHNTQNEVVPFFQKVLPVFRDNFTNFEIVCVNDACKYVSRSYTVLIFPDNTLINVGLSLSTLIAVGLESSTSDDFRIGFIEYNDC